MLLSVVIPFYHVEKYIGACLALAGRLEACELLLVDDGSRDSSGAICDRYAAQDSRIRVFHKENGGHGSTINEGLKIASGKYIRIIEINKSSFCSFVSSLLLKRTADFSNKSRHESVVSAIKKYDISTLKYSHNFSNCFKLKFLLPLSKLEICPLLS